MPLGFVSNGQDYIYSLAVYVSYLFTWFALTLIQVHLFKLESMSCLLSGSALYSLFDVLFRSLPVVHILCFPLVLKFVNEIMNSV